MTGDSLKEHVIAILRDSALAGSLREIDPNAQLGEGGLGLDSLALVQFISGLESQFNIEIPESIWIERDRMALNDIVDVIANLTSEEKPASQTQSKPTSQDNSHLSRGEKIKAIIAEHGPVGGIFKLLLELINRVGMAIYDTDRYLILAFDLNNQTIPDYKANNGVEFEVATENDLNKIGEVFTAEVRKKKLETIRTRLQKGYTCFLARINGSVGAIDWVTDVEDYEPYTGLLIKLTPGSCYGLDLNENPQYKNQGIGLATLAYSLRHSRDTGYTRQITVVHEKNSRMLQTSRQLFGFKKIGHIITRRIFGIPVSSWLINNLAGRGSRLVI